MSNRLLGSLVKLSHRFPSINAQLLVVERNDRLEMTDWKLLRLVADAERIIE